jgi:Fe-S cluster biogenesis protein NfuA
VSAAEEPVQGVGERIEAILADVRARADAATVAQVDDLVSAIVSVYGAGLARIVGAASALGLDGRRLAEDPLVRALFDLHGLVPRDGALDARVREALDVVRPALRAHGGDVELVGLDQDGSLSLRLVGSCHGCPSSTATARGLVESALYDAAPDLARVVFEGLAPELVQLGRRKPASAALGRAGDRKEPGAAP